MSDKSCAGVARSVRVGAHRRARLRERNRAAGPFVGFRPGNLRDPRYAAITQHGALRLGSATAETASSSPRPGVLARFDGLPCRGGRARSALGVLARFDSCTQPTASRAQPTTLDAVAGWPGAQLGRELASARLSGARPELAQATNRVGAQLALGDPDSDGNPELAYSSDTLDPTKDRLTLVTLNGSKLTPRFELPAPSISAVAICSGREGPGMAPLVIATGDELWLIR